VKKTEETAHLMNALPSPAKLMQLARSVPSDPVARSRVALVADTATQILAGSLKGVAHFSAVALDLFEAEYAQVDLQVMNTDSDLYRFAPETVIIFLSAEKFAQNFSTTTNGERAVQYVNFLEHIKRLHGAISGRGYQTICMNLLDPGDGIFGHFTNKVEGALTSQVRRVNLGLMELAQRNPDFHVFDLARLQVDLGREAMSDPKLYCTSKMALTPEATRWVARDLIQMLTVQKGGGRKCAILDLDNTLWGGVIGDDGLERIELGELGLGPAFSRFQSWLKMLKDRGIVLTVCSKNNLETAKQPFLNHPDMVLRLEDIAVFIANWNDKATNIRKIKEIVDVDYSAMVFLDDNPAERALVRESFPTMCVPEMPPDPCEYVAYLQRNNLFETSSYTAQDAQRTQAYQAEAQRRDTRDNFVNEGEFLQSLQMVGTVQPFEKFLIPRIAQLTQRSNQFNLRTVRYTETQIETLARSSGHLTFSFELRDRFGDYGLISAVILERRAQSYFIDTWLMSCRVLGRGMETLALNTIAREATEQGATELLGEYLPTAKNGMVKEHYAKLGFRPSADNQWTLDLISFNEIPVFIAIEGVPHGTVA
jgi:FkbH-like protein